MESSFGRRVIEKVDVDMDHVILTKHCSRQDGPG
jgi:hypothetical protein